MSIFVGDYQLILRNVWLGDVFVECHSSWTTNILFRKRVSALWALQNVYLVVDMFIYIRLPKRPLKVLYTRQYLSFVFTSLSRKQKYTYFTPFSKSSNNTRVIIHWRHSMHPVLTWVTLSSLNVIPSDSFIFVLFI